MRDAPAQPVFVPMDPRIRRRRIEVRRNEGRRRLRVIVVILVAVILTVACWLSLRSPLVDVDRIEVEGANRVTAEAVRQASGIEPRTAMIDVDADGAAVGVEQLPWVERAHVRRDWPATVAITVSERVAAAVAQVDETTWALLDPTGRVLEWAPERPTGLIALEGLTGMTEPGGTVEEARPALAVVTAMTGALAVRTPAVALVQSGEIELKLNPRGIVRFGPVEDTMAKLRAVETVLASVDATDLAVLDVRLPSSPVLTRG